MDRKRNAWVEHVRAYAKKNGTPYACAVASARCKQEYDIKKSKKSKKEKKEKTME